MNLDLEGGRRQPNPSFGLFSYLSDDLKHHIISFVADAPLEKMPENYPVSSLTHHLPAVSKKFHHLSQNDFFWRKAIARQTAREPFLWRKALSCISQSGGEGTSTETRLLHRSQAYKSSDSDDEAILLAHLALGEPSYKSLYQAIVSHHLRFKGPVLCRQGQIQLGVPYEIDSAEKLFYSVTRRVMQDHAQTAWEGGPLDGDAIFIHANRGPLARSTPAVLVKVLHCEIFPEEERAHLVLLPFAHVWLEKLWLCPESMDVIYAQCLKMTKGVSADMNKLARQEALAFIMDRLAGEVLESNFFDDLLEDDSDDEDDDSLPSSDDDSVNVTDGFSEQDNRDEQTVKSGW